MPNKDVVQALVDAKRSEIKALDDEFIGEVIGVAQAMGELRKALAPLIRDRAW